MLLYSFSKHQSNMLSQMFYVTEDFSEMRSIEISTRLSFYLIRQNPECFSFFLSYTAGKNERLLSQNAYLYYPVLSKYFSV